MRVVQGQIESVEVAPAALRVEAVDAAVDDQRYTLFRHTAVGTQRGIERAQVVARGGGSDHRRAFGDHDHIADAVCDLLAARGLTTGTVGLLGTDGTVAAGFFQQRFAARGLSCVVSSRPDQDALVLPAIACVKANDLPRAHELAVRAVMRLQADGAQAVVLACTETPLAIEYAGSPVTPHCVDATRALARACVAWHRRATGSAGRTAGVP